MNMVAPIQANLPANEPMESPVWDEPVGIIAEAARTGFDGEIYFTGETFRAKVAITAGRVAWVRCSTHDEFFGTFLRQELGISEATLDAALKACQSSGRRFGEELVARGIVDAERLRACLREHVSAHLWHLAHTRGDFEVEYVDQRYRYGAEFTFGMRELLETALASTVRRLSERQTRMPVAIFSCDQPGPLASLNEPTPQELLQGSDLIARRASYGVRCGEQDPGPSLFRTRNGDVLLQPLTLWSGLTAVVFAREGTPLGSLLGVAQACLPG